MTEIEIGQYFATKSTEASAEANETTLVSKAELEFLKGTKTANPNYERVLLHRIFKKLDFFQR